MAVGPGNRRGARLALSVRCLCAIAPWSVEIALAAVRPSAPTLSPTWTHRVHCQAEPMDRTFAPFSDLEIMIIGRISTRGPLVPLVGNATQGRPAPRRCWPG